MDPDMMQWSHSMFPSHTWILTQWKNGLDMYISCSSVYLGMWYTRKKISWQKIKIYDLHSMKVNGSIPIGDNFLSAFHIVVNLSPNFNQGRIRNRTWQYLIKLAKMSTKVGACHAWIVGIYNIITCLLTNQVQENVATIPKLT